MSRAGIVVALATEARALGTTLPRRDALTTLDDGALLAISGVGSLAAARASRLLLEAGANALVSFGLAGGLDPTLQAGSLLLPEYVCSADESAVVTDTAWRHRMLAALPAGLPVTGGSLWTSTAPVQTPESKRALFIRSGARAVDMEAAAVALAAREASVPFLAVKVIVDSAADSLPRAVMAVDPNGRIRAGRMASILLRHPAEIVALIRLAGRYRPAQRMLRRVGALRALRLPTAEITTR